jgi:predicted flap endonuclease-1-like 5' DNA nuclease
MVKKKKTESSDPHISEAYLAEGRERYTTPTPTSLSPTSIPNQPIASIPVPTPKASEKPSFHKKELLIIKGITEKTVLQLEKLAINNIDNLAQASAEDIAEALKVDLSTVHKWILAAKKLQ